MKSPNFIGIGVSKSGTTAVYHYLKQHPEIYMSPIKEPEFFVLEGTKKEDVQGQGVTTLEEYLALFQDAKNEKALGEISPRYFYNPLAASKIKQYLPESKIVVLLRHPVERAYSHYNMLISSGLIADKNFEEVFRENITTVDEWNQKEFACYGFQYSFYYDNLNRYFSEFEKNKIYISLYDNLVQSSQEFFLELFDFLEVDRDFLPDMKNRHNQSVKFKNSTLFDLIIKENWSKAIAKSLLPHGLRRSLAQKIHRFNSKPLPKLSPEIRQEFTQVYAEDLKKTEHLIEKDLSSWLT